MDLLVTRASLVRQQYRNVITRIFDETVDEQRLAEFFDVALHRFHHLLARFYVAADRTDIGFDYA